MSGLWAVVGPSGVGKDTLMQAAKARAPEIKLVRRVITRPHGGGEDFTQVSEARFAAMKAQGAFVLDWQAHGLHYGIPAEVVADLEAGHTALFNGSRAMLAQAVRAFPALRVLHITASDAVLAARLRARGRETDADIAQRLERARLPLPEGLDITHVDNSGDLDRAVEAVLAALYPLSAKRSII